MKKHLMLAITLMIASSAVFATCKPNNNGGTCDTDTQSTSTSNTANAGAIAVGIGYGQGGAGGSATGISGGVIGGQSTGITGGSFGGTGISGGSFGGSSSSSSYSGGNIQGQVQTNTGNTTTITSGDNAFTVEAARVAAQAASSRDAGSDAATIAAAKLQADAIRYASEQKIYNTPSVNGAALTSSNDTCMGSSSGSVNIPGLGIGGGTTWVDNNCRMLKNSRELWNMGMKAAAMALMCTDAGNKEALELTGFKCPQSKRDEESRAAMDKASLYNGTDPIVRARLGMSVVDGSGKAVVSGDGKAVKSN